MIPIQNEEENQANDDNLGLDEGKWDKKDESEDDEWERRYFDRKKSWRFYQESILHDPAHEHTTPDCCSPLPPVFDQRGRCTP